VVDLLESYRDNLFLDDVSLRHPRRLAFAALALQSQCDNIVTTVTTERRQRLRPLLLAAS
jgi:hypothetical protein